MISDCEVTARQFEQDMRALGVQWDDAQWEEYRARIRVTILRGDTEKTNGYKRRKKRELQVHADLL